MEWQAEQARLPLVGSTMAPRTASGSRRLTRNAARLPPAASISTSSNAPSTALPPARRRPPGARMSPSSTLASWRGILDPSTYRCCASGSKTNAIQISPRPGRNKDPCNPPRTLSVAAAWREPLSREIRVHLHSTTCKWPDPPAWTTKWVQATPSCRGAAQHLRLLWQPELSTSDGFMPYMMHSTLMNCHLHQKQLGGPSCKLPSRRLNSGSAALL